MNAIRNASDMPAYTLVYATAVAKLRAPGANHTAESCDTQPCANAEAQPPAAAPKYSAVMLQDSEGYRVTSAHRPD
jgi:hypothetical protein